MNYSIWVTARCNLGCKYCYEGEYKPRESMTISTAKEVILYIYNDFKNRISSEELVVNFHGGEPFLEVSLIQFFIKEIKRIFGGYRPIYFSLTTNATIMNEAIIELIRKEQIDITLSIDGTKETHDKLRIYTNGKGSHEIAIKNALWLQRNYTNIRIRMTYDGETVFDLEKNIKYLIDKRFKVIVPVENQFGKNWTEEGMLKLEEVITNVKKYIKEKDVLVGICDPIEIRKKGLCRGGISGKHIYINGDIYPCMMAGGNEEFKIGTIYSGIDDKKIREILNYSKCEHEMCKDCYIKQMCDGNRCKIINKLVSGNYTEPSAIKCAVNNVIFKMNGETAV